MKAARPAVAALLRVIVGKESALLRYAVDVRGVVAHHAQVVGADVGVADIVTKNYKNVGRFGHRVQRLRRSGSHPERSHHPPPQLHWQAARSLNAHGRVPRSPR